MNFRGVKAIGKNFAKKATM